MLTLLFLGWAHCAVKMSCAFHQCCAFFSSRQQDRHHYHTAPFSTEHCCCCRLHHQTGVCCQTLIWRAHLWSSSSRLRHSGRWVVTLQPETVLCLGRLLVVYKQYKQGSTAEESIGCNYHAVKVHDVDSIFVLSPLELHQGALTNNVPAVGALLQPLPCSCSFKSPHVHPLHAVDLPTPHPRCHALAGYEATAA